MSSPEQLDALVPVADRGDWLAVYTLAALAGLVFLWSILGRIPDTVQGSGILVRDSEFGIMDVTVQAPGEVLEVPVRIGAVVQPGQVLAKVDQGVLEAQLEGKEQTFRQIQRQDAEQTLAENDQLEILREKLRNQQELHERGLLTRSTVLGTKNAIYQLENQIHTRRLQLRELEMAVNELRVRLDQGKTVRSAHAGRVVEVLVDKGDFLAVGNRIARLESLTGEYEALLYVPAEDGKKILPGMEARVSPSTVKAQEYGYIVAEVRKVSDFPISAESLQRVLRNPTLVETLTASGPLIEVVATLRRDARTPSGFAWSSSEGPPVAISGGTLCTGSVVVGTRRPIEMLVPWIKETTGLY